MAEATDEPTGKIQGWIADASTGKLLAGVTIVMLGATTKPVSETKGRYPRKPKSMEIEKEIAKAVSDSNGYYLISSVPAGVCSLKATMIGYQPMIVKDVKVVKDSTTTVDFKLTPADTVLKGTGKIAGRVTDGQTGEALSGANVVIVGTTLGAASNLKGYYVIANVPAGVHSLKATMMGYNPVVMSDIKVIKNLTNTVNFKLTPTVTEMQSVEIKAERPTVAKDATGTTRVETSKEKTPSPAKPPTTPIEKPELPAVSPPPPTPPTKPPMAPEYGEAMSGEVSVIPSKPSLISGTLPSPGVKAGSADDNKQFNYYLNFLDRFKNVTAYKLDVSGRVIFTAKDITGRPLSNCLLTFRNRRGKILCRRKTYADGRAMFFTTEKKEYKQQDLSVEAEYNQKTVKENFSHKGRSVVDLNFPLNREKTERVPLDVAFLLDATGSMGDEIARLKATLRVIHWQITELPSKPDVRFGMVLYRDRGDEFLTRIVPFTDKVDSFQSSLDFVEAQAGGDDPEDVQEGLRQAITALKWRENGIRLLFLVADAPPHLDYGEEYTYIRAIQDASQKGIKITTIGASGLDIQGEYIFRQLAQYTMGQFVFLTYGETGESEGGTSISVSHHTGADFQTENLDAIIVRMIKKELSYLAEQPLEEEPEYFETVASRDKNKEDVLKELFSEGIRQLLDYSIVKIEEGTPTAILPISVQDKELKPAAENLEDRLTLNAFHSKAFRLVERKDFRQLMEEQKLALTGIFDSEKSIEVGKMVGAKILILSKLYRSKDKLELYIKMVKVETGEIMSITILRLDEWLI
ncbi:MAG: carboxypeptidase regulatory-like domain-containing protein [Candidatus Edwardsbacteria bacterium]